MIIHKHNILYKISIFQGLEEYKDDRYPNSIFYLKNNNIYFELDVENHILYCSYTLAWNVFSEQNKLDYYETQRVIKDVVGRYTNCGSITPEVIWIVGDEGWEDIRIINN